MLKNADKPFYSPNEKCAFISIFFLIKKCNIYFLTIILFLLPKDTFCQCPTSIFFTNKIGAIYKSTLKENKKKLEELQSVEQEMKVCKLNKDSSFMFLLQKMSVIYFNLGNFSNAINFATQSISIAREYGKNGIGDNLALVDNYSNLIVYYDSTTDTDKKYSAADSCIHYSLKGNTGTDRAVDALFQKADYLFNKGEYSFCIITAKLGEELTKKYIHGEDSIIYIVSFAMKEANSLYYSKNISKSEGLIEMKISQLQKAGYDKQLYAFYSLLGEINRDRKNYKKALYYFKESFLLTSTIKFKKGCAQNLAHIGRVYAKDFGQFETGLKYYLKALQYADATDSLFIFKETGNVYVLLGMYDKAQYFFQKAFNTIQQGMTETVMLKNFFQFPGFNQLQELSDLTTNKGDAFLQQYYSTKEENFLKKALTVYKKNDFFLTKIKTEQQLQINSSLVWRTTARNLYEHAIEACYANKKIEDAFYFYEKSRAILLNDQINEQRLIADSDRVILTLIKKNINDIETKSNKLSSSSDSYLTALKDLYNATEKLRSFNLTIKNNKKNYYHNYPDTASITSQQFQKEILKHSKSLLEIFAGDSAVYILAVTPQKNSFVKLDKQLYDSLTGSYIYLISKPITSNKELAAFTSTSQQLYQLIFGKLQLTTGGSLIVSPDGKSFPFEALVTGTKNGQPDYLLYQFATSYTYSASYLMNEYAANTKSSNSMLGLAPVKYASSMGLAELSGSDLSLQKIKKEFPNATNLIFENASKHNFFQQFPEYAIVQLYTHAADSSTGNDPVIYFADSSMLLSELIIDRKPITQLVVLSACETANGKLYQGEGIFSFNRGFAALGIPAAVSNLWSVENEATYAITELFYKYLAQGLPTDIALQKAKTDFISNSTTKEKKLPYYWAGPILTGKVDTITAPGNMPWKTILIAGIAVLTAGVFTGKYFLKNKRNHSTNVS